MRWANFYHKWLIRAQVEMPWEVLCAMNVDGVLRVALLPLGQHRSKSVGD